MLRGETLERGHGHGRRAIAQLHAQAVPVAQPAVDELAHRDLAHLELAGGGRPRLRSRPPGARARTAAPSTTRRDRAAGRSCSASAPGARRAPPPSGRRWRPAAAARRAPRESAGSRPRRSRPPGSRARPPPADPPPPRRRASRVLVVSPRGNSRRASTSGRHRPQHVGLILGGVGAARHVGLAVAPHEARVVAGGDARQAQLVGEADERRQAPGVAAHAGIRRLAGQVGRHERFDDRGLELGLAVDEVVREAEPLGRVPGALQGARRAAAAPVAAGPQAHGRRLQRASLVDQPQRRDGAVHSSAQGDECSCTFGSALRI